MSIIEDTLGSFGVCSMESPPKAALSLHFNGPGAWKVEDGDGVQVNRHSCEHWLKAFLQSRMILFHSEHEAQDNKEGAEQPRQLNE